MRNRNEMMYKEIEWVEMTPDVYGGNPCGSEHIPRFEACAEGDMGSDTMNKIEYFAKLLPAGTKITVSVPCCPNERCGLPAPYDAGENCTCGFNWRDWATDQYG